MSPAEEGSSGNGLRLAISACLLGEAVRYDGGHKRRDALIERFEPHVDWTPICPEVEAGLGVPRAPIQLEQAGDGVHLMGVQDRRDYTQAMTRCVETWTAFFEANAVAGLVLKQRSPSCGPGDAPLHAREGRLLGLRDGAFAAGVKQAFFPPPIVGDEGLETAAQRESFIATAEAHAAFSRVRTGAIGLRPFHRRHRTLVALRAPDALEELRRLRDVGVLDPYSRLFFHSMERVPEFDDHLRVLLRLADLLLERAPAFGHRRVTSSVSAYKHGVGNLAAVVGTLADAVERGSLFELSGDAYLEPGPLRLREYEHL
jgi:uncharacterized protein YbbK (DUF523 family)